MIITVRRFLSNSDATLSEVKIDGVRQCYGLEDEPRDVKVSGETRIPAGAYKIGVRAEGGFHKRYSKKFAGIHQGMLHVLDVPGFEFILIHVGNTEKDTAGCLLVGCDWQGGSLQELRVISSVLAYKALYQEVIGAALADDLVIHYIDGDR
jgi:hypothetical protein